MAVVDSTLHRAAALSERVEVTTQPVTVPRSTATLTIAADSLRRLPDGAGYSAHSGQAGLSVRGARNEKGETVIVVEATCDSLQLQCERYERTIRELRSSRETGVKELQEFRESQSREEKKSSNGILTAVKWLSIGILAGFLLKLRIKN